MLVALIPLVFILLAGLSILLRRGVIGMQVGLGLLGVWFLALLIAGFGAAKMASNYQQVVETSPAYQEISRTVPLDGAFTSLDLERGVSVKIVQATSLPPRSPRQVVPNISTRIPLVSKMARSR
jgi:hypothetical protein